MIKLEDNERYYLLGEEPQRYNFHLYRSKDGGFKRETCEDDCPYCKAIRVVCDIDQSDHIVRALSPREQWLFKVNQDDDILVPKTIHKAWMKYQDWERKDRQSNSLVDVFLNVIIKWIRGFPAYDNSYFTTLKGEYKIPIGYIKSLKNRKPINIQEAALWKPSGIYEPIGCKVEDLNHIGHVNV